MAKRYRGLTLGGLIVLLVLAAGAVYAYVHFAPQGGTDFEFTFSGNDLLGRPVSTVGSRGRVLVVNIFATWCGPCKIETPHLVEMYKELSDRGLDMVMVSEEPANQVTVFSRQFNIPYPVIADGQAIVDQVPGPRAYPTTVILDRKGVVRARIVGADLVRIRKVIEQLLAEK